MYGIWVYVLRAQQNGARITGRCLSLYQMCVDSADSVPFPILRFINVTKQFFKVSWNAVAVGCIIKRIANCSLKDISYLLANATGRMRIIGQP